MKVSKSGEYLCINSGFLYPKYELLIRDITSWGFIAEDNGATYFAFNYTDSTQYVDIPQIDGEELYEVIDSIRTILAIEPKLEISEIRVPTELAWLGAELTVGVLCSVLLSGSI